MLDEANVDQQEALGIIGVNLLYGAFYYHQPEKLIASLQENLRRHRIQVDMIKFSGPAYAGVDNRLMSLQLVSQGLTNAVMFTADGETVQPAEVFYKKAILVERGSFRPVTYATNDMLNGARRIFLERGGTTEEDLVVLMEMTLENLLSEGQLDHADFLARVDILGALGRTVLISKFGEYYRLAALSFALHEQDGRHSSWACRVSMEIFDEKYYLNLEGGILEALGRMFKSGLKLYVYPMIDEKTGDLLTATKFEVAPNLHSSLPLPDRQRVHPGDHRLSIANICDLSAGRAREIAVGRSGLGKDGAAGSGGNHQSAPVLRLSAARSPA